MDFKTGETGPDPFYYLRNFCFVIEWIAACYEDCLPESERGFIREFRALPVPSQALLVRMVMRTRVFFRDVDLLYAEIPEPTLAMLPLVRLGWVDPHPALTVETLSRVLSKAQLLRVFVRAGLHARMTKLQIVEHCAALYSESRSVDEWCGVAAERVYHLLVTHQCERLRAIFFGNFRQTWSEFVLADLGIYVYETVEYSAASRPFATVSQIEQFCRIFECRRMLEDGVAPDVVRSEMPPAVIDCEWLEARRQKLLFNIGRVFERSGDTASALQIYSACTHSGAADRATRIRIGRVGRARRLPTTPIPSFEFQIAKPMAPYSVERIVGEALSNCDGAVNSVHYVENMLVNSLFGLLCWRAIFAPVPGAFFHAFHREPVDLAERSFHRRRQREFADCFAELESGTYKATIRRIFVEKWGRASPFVSWRGLGNGLLELALECLPAAHLQEWFRRIVDDVPANRSGFPDLIQFWPHQGRYRMIEVKAPGDRVQENQRRWLTFCRMRDMPVAVCHVRWLTEPRSA